MKKSPEHKSAIDGGKSDICGEKTTYKEMYRFYKLFDKLSKHITSYGVIKYEADNITERFIQSSIIKYKTILPLKLTDEIINKLTSEIKEKSGWFGDFKIDYWNSLIKNSDAKCRDASYDGKILVIGDIKSRYVRKYMMKYSIDEVALAITRKYIMRCLGCTWSIPSVIYDMLSLNFTHEGFANILNNHLPKFCSPWKELDSLGSFFDQKSYKGKWVINPPFIESILNKVADLILSHEIKCLLIMPFWVDSTAYMKLKHFRRALLRNAIFEDENKSIIDGKFDVILISTVKKINPWEIAEKWKAIN